jgi:hypothetical protein
MKNTTLFLTLAISLLTTPAHALLRTGDLLGQSIVNHPVRGGRDEICVMPLHIPGAKYAKKDAERETDLCSYVAGENVAACPKRRSTSPATEYFTPPAGKSVAQLTAAHCVMDGAKKQAKLKSTVACTYTPSIPAYYHVSRALGNIGDVQPAVLVTQDLRKHQRMADWALQLLAERTNFPIYKWWSVFRDALYTGRGGELADKLFTDDYSQTYGALQRNPRGEKEYDEFNGQYGTDRLTWFKNSSPVYRALSNRGTRVGREFTVANVNAMRQMKDAADVILIDTLLNQQDRMGNMHYKEKVYYVANGALENADELAEVPEANRKGAVRVKELLLKDNDCGVNMENRFKKAQLLEGVAHMDPNTYKYFMQFAAGFETSASHDFFVRGLTFTENNFRKVGQNIKEAAALLKNRCQTGRLALDLDLKAHFTGKELPASYDCGN